MKQTLQLIKNYLEQHNIYVTNHGIPNHIHIYHNNTHTSIINPNPTTIEIINNTTHTTIDLTNPNALQQLLKTITDQTTANTDPAATPSTTSTTTP